MSVNPFRCPIEKVYSVNLLSYAHLTGSAQSDTDGYPKRLASQNVKNHPENDSKA